MVNNITNLTTSGNFYDIIVFTNQTTNGIMGMMMMTVTFFILFSLFTRRADFGSSLLASSFICFILSIMLSAIELVNPFFIILFGILTAISGLWLKMSGE